jgi:nucleolar protein TMA23
MDAAALLRAQGWRGKGFSLHPTNNTIGLSKPLLISRNTDGSGVGKKAHYTSDQWWLHAFDQKLKGLDTSQKGVVTQSVTQGKLDVVASSQPKGKYVGVSGLYSSFVRGGMLDGTMDDPAVTTTGDSTPATTSEDSEAGSVSRKEKRGESTAERQARKAGKRLRKAEKARRKEADRAVEKAIAKAAKKEMKRARKASETKEERRARKEERRARKEAKRKQAGLAQKADQG